MRAISLLLLTSLLACQRAPQEANGEKRDASAPLRTAPVPLDGALLARAMRALGPHMPDSMMLLEVRATSTSVEMQMIVDQGVTALRYREKPAPPGSQLEVPTGVVDPPVQVPVYGNGNLTENGFLPTEIDLMAIASAFPVAQKAVDPTDGWIRELCVRRFLPFGSSVRARIYVESPRMSGSIDTNGKGIPLGPSKM